MRCLRSTTVSTAGVVSAPSVLRRPTDVAGRGIDVKNIDLVVNYELPFAIENYTHRIGRTGRAGRAGTAVAFLTAEDADIMYDLKALLKSSNNAVPPELERHEGLCVLATNRPMDLDEV